MNHPDDFATLREAPLDSARAALCTLLERSLAAPRHGDAGAWQAAIEALPALQPSRIELGQDVVCIGQASDATAAQQAQLESALQALHPWRKGPFSQFGVMIDSEWRSDRKWRRLQDHIAPLTDRVVLDVGCGNGYYIWRMLGADAPMEAHKIDSRGIFERGRSADVKEGVVSFLEKRAPKFPDKVSKDMPPYFPWWDERKYK